MAFGGSAGSLFNSGGYNVAAFNDTSAANGQSFTNPTPVQPGLAGFAGAVGKSLMGLGKLAGSAVLQPLEQAGKTVAGIPGELVHSATGAVKETAALATGNKQAYANEVAKQQAYNKTSFIGKEYGQGNAKSLENAAGFAGTMLTLGAGSIPEDAAKTGVGLADRILNNAKDLVGVGKGNVASKAVRNAVLVQPTIQFAGKTAQDLADGNVKSAALDAAIWGLPGAASLAAKPVSAVLAKTGTAIFGKASILNDMFTPEVVSSYLENHPNDAATLKQIEQFTLNQRAVGGKTELAAPWLKNYVQATIPGVTQDEQGLGQLVTTMKPYSEELTKLQDLQASGSEIATDRGTMVPARDVTVSHNFLAAIPEAKTAIDAAISDPRWQSDMQFRVQSVKQAVGSLGMADETLNAQVSDALLNSDSAPEAAQNLEDVMRVGQKQIVKDLGNGFVYTTAPTHVAHMPTLDEVTNNELLQGQAPTRAGGALGRGLTKVGLSPLGVSDGDVARQLEANVDRRLDELNVSTSGRELIQALRAKQSTVMGASDLRMLTAKDVKEAVAGNSELRDVPPKVLAGVIRGAYRDLPASMVGAGGKLTNAIMNPLLSQYLRAQGVGRFELNPFFRGAKVPLKGGIVAVAHGANVEDMTKAYLGLSQDTERALENDSAAWFSANSKAGDSGTAAELGVGTGGQQVGRALRSQITGLVDSVAKAHGVDAQRILDEKGALYQELQKSVGLIKGYGTGGYLNSPLAKTLNLVVFPSRFDTKVIQSAAKIMGRMSPLQQVAVVHAGAQLAGFLQSPQGKQWAQENSQALGILSYFTPLETFQGVYNFAFHGQHAQDLGEFGGLPFGIINQIIQHQVPDLGHLGGSQYFSNGQPVATAFPITVGARVQQALTDIISSLFSYPGQTVGLGSKTKTIQAAVPALKPAPTSVQYRFANGSTEGSPNAPQPMGVPPTEAPPNIPNQPAPPVVPQITQQPTLTGPSRQPTRRAKAPKTVPLSQQLPGSNQF